MVSAYNLASIKILLYPVINAAYRIQFEGCQSMHLLSTTYMSDGMRLQCMFEEKERRYSQLLRQAQYILMDVLVSYCSPTAHVGCLGARPHD